MPEPVSTATAPTIADPQQRGPWFQLGGFVAITAVVLAIPLVLLLGWLGLVLALVLAGAAGWWAYASADRAVLRLSGAVPADPAVHARFVNVAEGLASANGLATPTLYVVEDPAPNSLVVGRDARRASLVATTGLLERLDRLELEAVVAHQLTYLRSGEVGANTLAVTTLGLITLFADQRILAAGGAEGGLGGAVLALAPALAGLLRLGLGEDRHAEADLAAIAITRYPPALISALEKLPDGSTVVARAGRSTAHLWFAAPLARTDGEGRFAERNAAFVHHPPIEVRAATLREL